MRSIFINSLLVSSLLAGTSVFAMNETHKADFEPIKGGIIKQQLDDFELEDSIIKYQFVIRRQDQEEKGYLSATGLTLYNGATYVVSGISYGIYTAGAGLYTAGSSVYLKAVEANQTRLAFKEGIDLYLPMKEYYNQPSSGASGKFLNTLIDYFNQPATPHLPPPPPMAIIMQGFARKFGADLSMLLKNVNRLAGPKITARLVKNLGLTQWVGEYAANKMLAVSNPLGWGSTIVSVMGGITQLATLAENNILKGLKLKVKILVAEQLGIPEEARDINGNSFSKFANDNILKAITYIETVEGLQNTLEKTLRSLVDDLEKAIKTDTDGKDTNLMASALRVFILGAEEAQTSSIIQTLSSFYTVVTTVLGATSVVDKVSAQPFSVIKDYTPTFVSEKVNNLADLINEPIGEAIGEKVAETINEKYIDGLKNIKLFTPEQMKLNLVQHAQSLLDNEKANSVIQVTDDVIKGYSYAMMF